MCMRDLLSISHSPRVRKTTSRRKRFPTIRPPSLLTCWNTIQVQPIIERDMRRTLSMMRNYSLDLLARVTKRCDSTVVRVLRIHREHQLDVLWKIKACARVFEWRRAYFVALINSLMSSMQPVWAIRTAPKKPLCILEILLI